MNFFGAEGHVTTGDRVCITIAYITFVLISGYGAFHLEYEERQAAKQMAEAEKKAFSQACALKEHDTVVFFGNDFFDIGFVTNKPIRGVCDQNSREFPGPLITFYFGHPRFDTSYHVHTMAHMILEKSAVVVTEAQRREFVHYVKEWEPVEQKTTANERSE